MTQPSLTFQEGVEAAQLQLSGSLLTEFLGSVEQSFHKFATQAPALQIDMSQIDAVDTGGAWLILELRDRLQAQGVQVDFEGVDPDHAALLKTVEAALPQERDGETGSHSFTDLLEDLGKKVVSGYKEALSLLGFFGETLVSLSKVILRPWTLRRASLFSHMQDAGLNAMPIVALMGFLIGVVLAFQGATQLRQFGAEVFVVELISISILRELGILLTAIIVAGRSGSAFTASVGSMKVQEEIDALRTLGLDPINVLVLPRVLALFIVLPILGFTANIFGLIGGGLMSWIELGVSPGMFVTRLHEHTSFWHLAVGMIKAPFFAVVIGVVACWQAFRVQGSSTSVGQRTTAAVVQGIFLVIAIDALFSVFFASIGI